MLEEMQSSSPASVTVLKSCDLLSHSKEDEAIKQLQAAIQQKPSSDLCLLLIQALLNQRLLASFVLYCRSLYGSTFCHCRMPC